MPFGADLQDSSKHIKSTNASSLRHLTFINSSAYGIRLLTGNYFSTFNSKKSISGTLSAQTSATHTSSLSATTPLPRLVLSLPFSKSSAPATIPRLEAHSQHPMMECLPLKSQPEERREPLSINGRKIAEPIPLESLPTTPTRPSLYRTESP